MFDDLDRLRSNAHLRGLLDHYAGLGRDERETWRDRLMQLDGIETAQLVRLHGELLAFGWIDQNTGHTPLFKPGVVAACYRITSAGLRALKQASVEEVE
jgi:hypothetical protein